MRTSHLFSALAATTTLMCLAAPASAQFMNGPGPNMHTFSPVHGAQPMMSGMSGMSGMSAQQMQMAQMYMLYGMMGMGGGRGVQTGVPNPIVGGGFSNTPYIDNSGDYGQSNSKHAHTNREELRAQRAEQKRQAQLAKANAAAANKAAGKAKGKKNAAGVQ